MRQIKDPIYGYVNVSKKVSNNIIDTPEFQRLRNIRQTSYSSLYPSAFHNRFIHSIGVYYLGAIATKSLRKANCFQLEPELDKSFTEQLGEAFSLACLLHDVGHSPFSHSGEVYYITQTKDIADVKDQVIKKLYDCVDDAKFKEDADKRERSADVAAPHEIVSVIVALQQFKSFIPEQFRDFFARAILGYKYSTATDTKTQIKNCFIQVLNSTLIDVDRLDYLIRDSYTTGFQSISIDYQRLLQGLTIIRSDDKYQLAYKKSALSVIENVVYAHDAEKKWLQHHPSIVYDSFLVDYAISAARKYYDEGENRLFSVEALSQKGISFESKGSIRLLADEDILFTVKNEIDSDPLIDEYFNRSLRRHAAWKSESEYRALFEGNLGSEKMKKLVDEMDWLCNYMSNHDLYSITPGLIDWCTEEEARINAPGVDDQSKKAVQIGLEKLLKWVTFFEGFASKNSLECDFSVVMADRFRSTFAKKDLGKVLIWFKELDRIMELEKVLNTLSASAGNDKYFYLFYRRNEPDKLFDGKAFADHVYNHFNL